MKTYIALLRGINVSGHRPLKMAALREMLQNLGFKEVNTYVQSGNVVFKSSEKGPQTIADNISGQIEEEYGYDVPVRAFTTEKLKATIENNPFANQPGKDPEFFHITFLSSTPDNSSLEEIEAKKQEGEAIVLSGDVIYLYCPKGYGRTKLNNQFLERKLKVGATTRNWKTVNKLIELAAQINE